MVDVGRDVSSKREQAHVARVSADPAPEKNTHVSGRKSTKGRRFKQRRNGHHRPSRERCTQVSYLVQCAPTGSAPTPRPILWMRAVRSILRDTGARADFRRSVERCLMAYVNGRTPQGFSTAPSWKKEDVEAYGISRTTWHRVWKWLMENKLLGWAAHGRQAKFKPKKYQEEGNDMALYVFCIPVATEPEDDSAPPAESPVDISGTMFPQGESFSSYPPHAHGYTTDADGAPHRLKNTSGGSAAFLRRLLPALPQPVRGDITAKASKNKAVRAVSQDHFARTLKHFVPALNSPKISDRHLAYVLRQGGFFAADWTVNDIRFALDRRFDGTPWPHDGATGIGNLAKWLAFRLEPWRDEFGRPRQSPSQRQRTVQAEARAQKRRDLERIQRQEAERAERLASGEFDRQIAELRATLRDLQVSH